MSTAKRADLVKEWQDKGLLTAKHDPKNKTTTWASYRTILTHEVADNLDGLIKSGEFDLTHYYDKRFPKSSGVYELTPTGAVQFNVAGSGLGANSLQLSGAKDTLLIASDKSGNWKCYADNASDIQQRVADGRLIISGKL